MNNTTLNIDNGFGENIQLDINYHDEESYQVLLKGINITWILDDETHKDVVKQIAEVDKVDHNNCDRMEIIKDGKY